MKKFQPLLILFLILNSLNFQLFARTISAEKIVITPPNRAVVFNNLDLQKYRKKEDALSLELPSSTIENSLAIMNPIVENWKMVENPLTKKEIYTNYIGKQVIIKSAAKNKKGALISISDGKAVIKTKEGLVVTAEESLLFPNDVEYHLLPQLELNLKKTTIRTGLLPYTYHLSGINSSINYFGNYDEKNKLLTFTGTLNLKSSDLAEIRSSQLILRTGLPIINEDQPRLLKSSRELRVMSSVAGNEYPEQIDESYDYYLKNSVQIKKGETISIPFLQNQVPAQKIYQYTTGSYFWYSADSLNLEPVNTVLRFRDELYPLASGYFAVYQDNDFLGKNRIKTTAKGDEIDLIYSKAMDIQAKKYRVNQTESKNSSLEIYRLVVSNFKDNMESLEIIDVIPGNNWKLISFPKNYEKLDSNRIKYVITVAAKKTVSLKYTISRKLAQKY